MSWRRTTGTKVGLAIIIVAGTCLLQVRLGLGDEINPADGPGGSGHSVKWLYASPLTIVETITDLGAGSYRYSYSLKNVDSSPIWLFGINTTFVTQGGTGGTKFTGHSTWGGPSWIPVTSCYPAYDARNLDPNILGLTYTWTIPWEDLPSSIQVGETTSGFSFIASTYDTSPKYYFYETIASGYTQTNGGWVAAVGLTVPEPATLSLLVLGGLALMRRRRK